MNLEIKVDDEWEWYIGMLYANIIKCLPIKDYKTIVELAPGFRYKIAYALKEINFAGDLYIIDINKDVLSYVYNKYKELLPNSNIKVICSNFNNSLNMLPNTIDLFLSNHPIDDLIISEYNQNKTQINLFNKDYILNEWDKLVNENYDVIINQVYNTFIDLFNSKNIKYNIIGQYKSNLFFKDNYDNIDLITKKCFNKIKKVIKFESECKHALDFYPFGTDERYLGNKLLNNTQNLDNWIIGKYNNCNEK